MTNQPLTKFFCPLCPSECGLLVKVNPGSTSLIKIHPDKNDPVSKGYVCQMAATLAEETTNTRITEPLKRVDGKLVPVSWDIALSEIADKLSSIVATYGGDKIFYMQNPHQHRALQSVYVLKFLEQLGVKYFTNILSIESIEKLAATVSVTGNPQVIPDVSNSQVHLIIGKNAWVTNGKPNTRTDIKQIANDTARTLIVIDPVNTETAKLADLFIQIRPGTDAWLLLAIVKIMIDNDFINYSWIQTHCNDFDTVLSTLADADISECLSVSGVEYNTAFNIAKAIYEARGFSYSCELGIEYSLNSKASSYLIVLLAALTGNFDVPGGMMYANKLISPALFINLQPTTPITQDMQIVGTTPANMLAANLYESESNKFHALFIDQVNPIGCYPNKEKLKDAFRKVGLVVVLDTIKTETTEFADYVLPITQYPESYGLTNASFYFENIVHLRRPIMKIPPNVKTPFDIVNDLTMSMLLVDLDKVEYFSNLLKTNKLKFVSELRQLYSSKDLSYLYIIYNTLGTQFEDPSVALVWWYLFNFRLQHYNENLVDAINIADTQLTQLLTVGHVCFVPEKINKKQTIKLNLPYLALVKKLDKTQLSSDTYKFILSAGFKQKSNLNNIVGIKPTPYVEIQECDARDLDLSTGEIVKVSTSSGELKMPCSIVTHLQPGYIRTPWCSEINVLTETADNTRNTPNNKFIFANITKENGL